MKDKISQFTLKFESTQFQLLLLLLWMVIGTGLRSANLTGKSPWTDEFATMVFSLGNSFATVPLDKAIALDVLMQPLQPNPAAGASTVIHLLLTEDTHPPLYFVLANWWMKLFAPGNEGYLSLWGARSLPALFGVLSIPAVYVLSRLAFRVLLVAQMAAAMMAVSPYGIYISQEARHYSLGILWVIASLSFLVMAARHFYLRKPLQLLAALGWVAINCLGIGTHYFFILTLFAEAMVLIGLGWHQFRGKNPVAFSHWWRIVVVALGTATGSLVWLSQWQRNSGSGQMDWLYSGSRSLLEWLNPVFQSFATGLTMLCLLPVEAPSLPVVIVSGLGMLIFFIWVIPILIRGIKTQWQQPETRLATGVLGGFVLGAIAIFFAISYGLGIDITRGARYNFLYFPAVIALLGASLAVCWNTPTPNTRTPRINGKTAVAIILLMGFVSGITVVNNLGYRKYYRPDILVPTIQQTSSVPVLIATTHNTLTQTGEMMGIAWEFKRAPETSSVSPQFLLAHQEEARCESTECRASAILQQTVRQLPQPMDLWLVNFHAPVDLESQKCFADKGSFPGVYGYDYKLYHCRATSYQ